MENPFFSVFQTNPCLFLDQRSNFIAFLLIFFSLTCSFSPSYEYDSLDPYANVTITWDFLVENGDTFDVRVSLYNYQLFRHVELPGWKLGWSWKGDEVIWSMWGAEATQQGNCSKYIGKELPHCCEKKPVIVDLMPGAPYKLQVANCCKGGVLSSMRQDPANYGAAFQMNIGKSAGKGVDSKMPANFTLGLPGYTCSDPFQVSPTKFSKDGGRRWTQVLETWNVTCVYSQFRSSPAPGCCVSLSSFYNSTIIPCPRCSCGCQGLEGTKCVESGETPSVLQLPHEHYTAEVEPLVRCSQHMCPIRVHWHVKQSYTQYWRVKITITNLNFAKNYSQWSLVVLHPNLRNITQVFSFNYSPLNQYGHINDTGMFWGIQFYNDLILTSGERGNVQTEMLLQKDSEIFTFREGWAFPRRILFNGDECVMPPPDQYPRLPNEAHRAMAMAATFKVFFFFSLCILITEEFSR
ncbi:COBRA-like protein 6 [Cucurbita pepo subsp. pepo]|uniref:COBRA-like protein 6 n=1 Tax=Cucurbita pepo subsp. pepo TaxID=3664 RepID=UPI000C9D6741|nr:COBRA-like protein 6 [Cucurbita pepo subsp. pepo]